MFLKLKNTPIESYLSSLEKIATAIHSEKNTEKVVFFILLNLIDKLNLGFTEGYFFKYDKQNKSLKHINSYFDLNKLSKNYVNFLIDTLDKEISLENEILNKILKSKDVKNYKNKIEFIPGMGILEKVSNFTIIPIYHEDSYYGCFILSSDVKFNADFTVQEMHILELFKYNFSLYMYTRELENKEIENLRLQTVGSFATAIVHELRTPISSILGFASLAKRKIDDPEKIQLYLDYIIEESNTLIELCEDISEYSSDVNKVLKPITTVKISDVIRKIIKNLDSHLKKSNIKINFLVEGDFNLKFNEKKLITAFNHIIKNSIENCDFNKDERYIQITISTEKEKSITIKDNGIGIRKDLIEQVTAPFYSSKLYGTGLGLTIAQETFAKSNLAFTIKSEHKQWTEIKLIKE